MWNKSIQFWSIPIKNDLSCWINKILENFVVFGSFHNFIHMSNKPINKFCCCYSYIQFYPSKFYIFDYIICTFICFAFEIYVFISSSNPELRRVGNALLINIWLRVFVVHMCSCGHVSPSTYTLHSILRHKCTIKYLYVSFTHTDILLIRYQP